MNTKIHKIFISLVMILITFLGLGSAVVGNATVTQNIGSIHITTANNIDMTGKKFDAYQMFTAEKVGENEVNYTLVSGWEDFFKQQMHDSDTVTSEEARNYVDSLKNDQAKLDKFAADVVKYAQEKPSLAKESATASKDSATISNLPYGYYLVVDTSDRDSVAVAKDALVTVDSSTPAQVKLKADAPTIDKHIGEAQVVGNYNIGDKVPFTLKSKVPSMDGYSEYTYIIHDTMSKGLTFNKSSVQVTIGGQTLDPKYYQVTTNDTGFDIVFGNGSVSAYDIFKAADAGSEIKVTYDATLNENAVIGSTGNPNNVNLEYSNNPYDESSHKTTPDSTVKVYTFALDITKTNVSNKKLAGAEFEVQTKSGKKINVKKTGEGTYVVDETSGSATVVTSSEGKVIIKGLNAGEYQLVETKAPDGYNTLEKPIEFVITPEYGGEDNMTLTNLTTSNNFTANKDNGTVSTTVVNKTGGLLPETGGRGIIAIALAGIILIGGASYIVYRKRKEA